MNLEPLAYDNPAEKCRQRRIEFVLGDPATVPAKVKVISYLLCRDLDAQCMIFSDEERALFLADGEASPPMHEDFLNTIAGRVAFRDWLTGPDLDS